MASVINNLSQNMPAKARVMIIMTIVMVVGLVIFTIMRISGGGSTQSEGMASIPAPPSQTDINKDLPTDQPIFADDSEVGKIYMDSDKKAADEAISGSTTRSHLDTLRLSLESEKKPETAPVSDPVSEQQSDLQKILDMRRDERVKLEKDRAARSATQQAQAVNNAQANPYQMFIDEERKLARETASLYGQEIAGIKANTTSVAKAGYESGDSEASSEASTGGPLRPQQAGYEQYLASNNRQTSQASPKAPAEQDYDVEVMAPKKQRMDYPSERIAAGVMSTNETNINVSTGELFYGVLQIGANTDEPSPIRAVVVENGPLKGAVFVGDQAVRSGEKAVLQFQSMSINGRSQSISVVALDPDTMRTGFADGVDRHTFERYTKLFAASFIEGYADGLTSGQTTTNTDGSSSTITDSLPKASDQALVGLGKVGEKFSPIFEREFDRPPTITVDDNKTIILMFMSPLDLKESN